jgi:hypothetical protein
MTNRVTLMRHITARAERMPDATIAAIFPQAHELATCSAAPGYYGADARSVEQRRAAWHALRAAHSARQTARRRRALCVLPTEGGAA